MYAAEAEGLSVLRAAGVRAPEPFAHGAKGGEAYLEMERLALGAAPDWPAAGRMLAALHRNTAPRFGWEKDNWIGLSPQKNGWREDWSSFFLDFRLRPQLEMARRNGYRIEIGAICDLLQGHAPRPSLLHGDLWGGNVGFTAEGPVIYDPAVYFGDREADMAMSELFGGFPPPFYRAYNAEWPLDRGYAARKHLYNLYHLLNHLNIFGGAYLDRVVRTIGILERKVRSRLEGTC
jgi:fructosamine-3-kinase